MSHVDRTPVIIDAVRTPVGRAGGALSSIRADDLLAHAIRALVERTGVSPGRVEDVIAGCTNQAGEDNRNVARMAGLLAGLPVAVGGQTVNRLCGSGVQAAVTAAHAIRAGEGDVFIAGGVECMSRAPWVMLKTDRAFSRVPPKIADTTVGWRFANPAMPERWTIPLAETAEVVAEEHGVGRGDQDAFAVESQRRAAAAIEAGRFDDEIAPIDVPQRKGDPVRVASDEHPRPGTTAEQLARLRAAFRADGTVTAGNASGINDGAAAVLMTSRAAAEELGLEPMARVGASAIAGVDPHRMGIGPVPATRKALERAGLTVDDIDLIELNEAFAAQSLPCITELGLDPDRVNVNGGAIALGHPLGCTGAKLLTTLVHEMRRRDASHGLVTMCIGVGQGIALLVHRDAAAARRGRGRRDADGGGMTRTEVA